KPTELGFLVTDLLVSGFPEIMDIDFTAQMEKNLDKIERGEAKWTKVLQSFYTSFEKELKKAQKEMKGELSTDIPCPECGGLLKIKAGRNGLFLGCSSYPGCKYTTNFTRDDNGKIIPQEKVHFGESGETCEICGRAMIEKRGKFGPFIACSGYPECKNTRRIEKETGSPGKGIPCPNEECNGFLVERVSKKK
ncbi:MAG: topoisomerase DNA-binding C4 zinc finger domain-containing protein, partial [Pseudomonadota bacterium]